MQGGHNHVVDDLADVAMFTVSR